MNSRQIELLDVDDDSVWRRVSVPVGIQIRSQVTVSVEIRVDSVLDNFPALKWVIGDQAMEDNNG